MIEDTEPKTWQEWYERERRRMQDERERRRDRDDAQRAQDRRDDWIPLDPEGDRERDRLYWEKIVAYEEEQRRLALVYASRARENRRLQELRERDQAENARRERERVAQEAAARKEAARQAEVERQQQLSEEERRQEAIREAVRAERAARVAAIKAKIAAEEAAKLARRQKYQAVQRAKLKARQQADVVRLRAAEALLYERRRIYGVYKTILMAEAEYQQRLRKIGGQGDTLVAGGDEGGAGDTPVPHWPSDPQVTRSLLLAVEQVTMDNLARLAAMRCQRQLELACPPDSFSDLWDLNYFEETGLDLIHFNRARWNAVHRKAG